MLIIEQLPAEIDLKQLCSRERDTAVMTFEERRWLRRRFTTTRGRAIGLALATGSRLTPGAILAIEPDWYLQVEAAPEALIAIYPHDQREALRLAFEVGNHHFPLAIEHAELLVPDDSAMSQLLTRLGAQWERRMGVFDPIGGGHQHGDR